MVDFRCPGSFNLSFSFHFPFAKTVGYGTWCTVCDCYCLEWIDFVEKWPGVRVRRTLTTWFSHNRAIWQDEADRTLICSTRWLYTGGYARVFRFCWVPFFLSARKPLCIALFEGQSTKKSAPQAGKLIIQHWEQIRPWKNLKSTSAGKITK